MDPNTFRIVFMIASIVIFAGIVWWAYGPGSRARAREAEQLVFDDTDKRDS